MIPLRRTFIFEAKNCCTRRLCESSAGKLLNLKKST